MKVVIVGGVAGGGSAAARIRRLNENATIIIFEKGPFVSFANCGLPYYIGDVIPQEKDLLVFSPEQYKGWFNIDARTNHEVLSINRENKSVLVKNGLTGETFEESYDYLVLSTGSKPFVPRLPGCDLPGVFQLRDIPDSNQIKSWIADHHATDAVVVGGGFIGLEMAENLCNNGLHVSLIELSSHVMPALSGELASIIESTMRSHGIELYTNSGLEGITSQDSSLCVTHSNGQPITCQLVIISIGVSPNSTLAKDCQLPLGPRGSILVDSHMRTGDPTIFAVGDAVQVTNSVTGLATNVPLAGPANREGRLAGDVLCGFEEEFRGVQGTAVCKVFDLTIAMTGETPDSLKRWKAKEAESAECVHVHSPSHASYYPGASPIHLNLTFDRKDGRVLGAQAVGTEGVDKRIDVLSVFVQMKAKVSDVAQAELCYAPPFGSAKDVVNMAGMIAEDVWKGLVEQASWEECFEREDIVKLDVRSKELFNANPLPGFVNIPLNQVRESLDKIPKEKEVFVSCNVGKTAYFATRILTQHGYKAKLLPGGWNTYCILPKKLSVCYKQVRYQFALRPYV